MHSTELVQIFVLKDHLLTELVPLKLNLARLKCLAAISRLILHKIPRPPRGWVLSMNRTNWKYGKRHIIILTIGIVGTKPAHEHATTRKGKKEPKRQEVWSMDLLHD